MCLEYGLAFVIHLAQSNKVVHQSGQVLEQVSGRYDHILNRRQELF